MESWFENWTKADYFSFICAVVGLAALLLGALNVTATVSTMGPSQSRGRYRFSVYAVVVGSILVIAGASYLIYSKQQASARKPTVDVDVTGAANRPATPAPTPAPQPASTPERRDADTVETSSFKISTTNDSSWRYNYCVDGDFAVDVKRRSDTIDFVVTKAVINACTESRHDYSHLLKIRLGVWNYGEKPKKGGSQTVWSETPINETIPLGEDHSIKPFTASIRSNLPKNRPEQTLIIQLVFAGSGRESKVSYFDKEQRLSY